jgi:hypothetical protein
MSNNLWEKIYFTLKTSSNFILTKVFNLT